MADPAVRDEVADDGVDPPYLYPDYVGTRLRAPTRPLVRLPRSRTESSGPVFGAERVQPGDADLTHWGAGEAIGQRIIVHGTLRDSDGRPIRNRLIEVWQANAAGRYRHDVEVHDAPLDPNFDGAGRCVTDDAGRYRFVTIRPGAYPWRNHLNAWRPAHIHFSLFGDAITQRLVTQMYFPGDPLFAQDPIMNSIPDPRGRERLIASLDMSESVPEWAIGFRWDIVLRGREATPLEQAGDDR